MRVGDLGGFERQPALLEVQRIPSCRALLDGPVPAYIPSSAPAAKYVSACCTWADTGTAILIDSKLRGYFQSCQLAKTAYAWQSAVEITRRRENARIIHGAPSFDVFTTRTTGRDDAVIIDLRRPSS